MFYRDVECQMWFEEMAYGGSSVDCSTANCLVFRDERCVALSRCGQETVVKLK